MDAAEGSVGRRSGSGAKSARLRVELDLWLFGEDLGHSAASCRNLRRRRFRAEGASDLTSLGPDGRSGLGQWGVLTRPPASSIPDSPGSYQFKDAQGRVIYVGKAKSLRSRLSNYFAPPETLLERTRQMVATADTVEWIEVAQRGRGALPRVQPHQAAPAPLQHPAEGRQVVPVPRGHPRRGVAAGDGAAGRRSARASATSGRTRTPTRSARRSTCCCARSRSARARKNKFDRHHRLGRPCLYAHIEKCAAPCVGDDRPRGVRRRSSHELLDFLDGEHDADPRPARQADARGEPTRSSSSARRACATSSSRCARRSSASRWSTPRRRTTTSSGSPRTRSRRRCRCSYVRKGRVVGRKGLVVDKVEDVDTPELVGRLARAALRRRRRPTTSRARSSCPTLPEDVDALRGVPRLAARARRCASACRSGATSASCSQTVTQNARGGVRAAQAQARVRPQRARPRAARAAGGARPARGAAAHRVLRHLEPAGHRDRRRRWW